MIRSVFTARIVVCAFGGVLWAPVQAQPLQAPLQALDPPGGNSQGSEGGDFHAPLLEAPPDAAPAPASYVPLTLGEKYLFSINKVFSPGSTFLYGLRAGIDQWRDTPHQWGTGADSYAVRSASFFGRSLIRENIAFGVRALDHEDPRYFVLGRGTKWTRIRYAMVRTFLVRNDSGGTMPAYSLFASAFTAPYLAEQWRPEHFAPTHPLTVGSARLGIAMGSDIFQEFWPDIRNKLDLDRRLHRIRHP